MAERRMIAKSIIDSDAFLEMPLSSQALYFHLNMRADDDGFINNQNRILKMIGGNLNDMDILKAKEFVINFGSGVLVIKHWRMHNYIRKDRHKETIHIEELQQLEITDTGMYEVGQPNGNQWLPQVRLGKDRLGKVSIEKSIGRFTPPTLDDVKNYCKERKNKIDPQTFCDYYEANGWMVGRTKMKNWQASIRTWEKRDSNSQKQFGKPEDSKPKNQNFKQNTISSMGEDEMREVLKRKADRKVRGSD